MNKSLKKIFKFLVILLRSDASKLIKLDFLYTMLIRKMRIKHLCFSLKVIYDYLTIKKKKLEVFGLRNLSTNLSITTKAAIISDNDVLRIANAFNRAKTDQVNQPKQYKIGGEWKSLILNCHKELRVELKNRNINNIRKILSNFGQNKISGGLQLYYGIPTTKIQQLAYLNWFNKSYYNWSKLTNLPDAVLEYPNDIGNIPGVAYNEALIPLCAFRLSYYAYKICKLLKSIYHPTIIEIGGGIGGIPFHIFKSTNLNMTYIDLDIPETCVIASYFLISSFPTMKILLYGEANIADINLNDYDMLIMPNFVIKELPSRSCDLAFNSHSLGEMNIGAVKNYLSQLDRLVKIYFLHFNDEYRLPYIDTNGRFKTRINLNDPNFKLSDEHFKQLYRLPEVIWNDGGYIDYRFESSYYEYLYKRIQGIIE